MTIEQVKNYRDSETCSALETLKSIQFSVERHNYRSALSQIGSLALFLADAMEYDDRGREMIDKTGSEDAK